MAVNPRKDDRDRASNPGISAIRKASLRIRAGVLTSKVEHTWGQSKIYGAIEQWTGADAELNYCGSRHLLILTLSGKTDFTETLISGAARYEGRDGPGCVTFVPAGTDRLGRYRNANLNSIVLQVAPDYVRSWDLRSSAELKPFTNRRDALLESVLWSLSHEMQRSGNDLLSLYAEHATGLAMTHLMRIGPRTHLQKWSRGRLSEAELTRVFEFIEGKLDRDLSLSQLGALVDMEADIFARSFKLRTGGPPYRYVTRRRMQRAAALIVDGGKPIAEIALAVGYSSQSHFTTHFSRFFNVTPTAYQALHR